MSWRYWGEAARGAGDEDGERERGGGGELLV